jgi:Kef-type K+ transport system membrane component KefB
VAPLLSLGLGWIGFVIGSRFDARTFERIPQGTSTVLVLSTALPIAAILLACGLVLYLAGESVTAPSVVRDALLLATAGAMTARSAPQFLLAGSTEGVSKRLIRIIEFEQLAGVFGLMLVSAYFRPPGAAVAWHLPGTAWLFITLGVGTTMGVVISATLTRINRGTQFTTVLLGAVAFTAGMASFLRLSPVSVCFIAGAIMINLAGAWRDQVRRVLERLERPIYFLFLVIAGALWLPWEWQGWVLMALFLTSRVSGKWLAVRLLARFWVKDLSPGERLVLTKAPMGALSVAIVVTAQDLFFGQTVPWIVTAVIGSAILMEVGLQAALRGARLIRVQPENEQKEPHRALSSW